MRRCPARIATAGEIHPRPVHAGGKRGGRFGGADQAVGAAQRAHLRQLTAQRPRTRRTPPPERLSPLMRSFGTAPAMVLGRRTDVLAWNALGHALLAGHIDATAPGRRADRPNLARMLFLGPHIRDLDVNWHRKARAVVGKFRVIAGRHPDDARLAALIGELSMKSPEFTVLWSDHRVAPCEADEYELRHPLVGTVTVAQHILTVARSPEQSVVVVTTAEGSGSEHAITDHRGQQRRSRPGSGSDRGRHRDRRDRVQHQRRRPDGPGRRALPGHPSDHRRRRAHRYRTGHGRPLRSDQGKRPLVDRGPAEHAGAPG
ncbi:MmyB family transcriptional regulator [Nocardia terpenica]|uniref:MmyB family transcriptional regulator n=1 Tax=Nocardia terpenica TaxID=455432 RepID=UPI002B4B1D64|nr:hypothetical protein [Nocardia terpenica]